MSALAVPSADASAAPSAQAAKVVIEAVNVTKRFSESVIAVEGASFSVEKGSFVSLVGPSGCGKSTLLRLIAGLIPMTSGTLTVNGREVDAPRKDVGMMFQRPTLLEWRTAVENVLLPTEVMGKDQRRYRERAYELLEMTGLKGFEHHYPRQLSGGMQQRVSLCRSLIHDPAVLLMDEPFAALDALTREELSIELQRICASQRKTVIFVTHSIEEAVLLADRVVVMTPRPGTVKKIVPIEAKRPRTLGMSEQIDTLARAAGELRELLFDRTEGGRPVLA